MHEAGCTCSVERAYMGGTTGGELDELKRRYAECQRAESAAWARSEETQAAFRDADRRGLTFDDRRYGMAAGEALKAWSAAHARTLAAAAALRAAARAEAVRKGWIEAESPEI